jgi:hypothetical protein
MLKLYKHPTRGRVPLTIAALPHSCKCSPSDAWPKGDGSGSIHAITCFSASSIQPLHIIRSLQSISSTTPPSKAS